MSARLTWAIVCAGLISTLGVTACGSAEPSAPPTVQPIASCVSPEEQRAHGITVKGAKAYDGLEALVYGSGTTGIVLANQADSDLCVWMPYAEVFAEKGYQALIFNYSSYHSGQDDVLRAASGLRERGATDIFLIGASKGGTMALAAAAVADPPVAGVISLSGPWAYEGINAFELMGQLKVPAIFAAAELDTPFSVHERALYEAAASTDKQLVMRPGGRHGIVLLDEVVTPLVEAFIEKHSAG